MCNTCRGHKILNRVLQFLKFVNSSVLCTEPGNFDRKFYLPTDRRREGTQRVEMIFHQAQNPNKIYFLLKRNILINIFVFSFFSEIWQVLFYFNIFLWILSQYCPFFTTPDELYTIFLFIIFFILKPKFTRSLLATPLLFPKFQSSDIDSSRVS